MSPDFGNLSVGLALLYTPESYRIRLHEIPARIPTLLLPPCARLPLATVLSCSPESWRIRLQKSLLNEPSFQSRHIPLSELIIPSLAKIARIGHDR